MKIKIFLAALFISIASIAGAQVTVKTNSQALIETPSKYSFAATVDSLYKTAIANGWKVTATHDLQETMKKNGKEVLPVKVLEICNPGLAFQILSKDEVRDASVMLPCRISVYNKADGKTYISRMNMPMFSGMIGAEAERTAIQAFNLAEGFIKTVTD